MYIKIISCNRKCWKNWKCKLWNIQIQQNATKRNKLIIKLHTHQNNNVYLALFLELYHFFDSFHYWLEIELNVNMKHYITDKENQVLMDRTKPNGSSQWSIDNFYRRSRIFLQERSIPKFYRLCEKMKTILYIVRHFPRLLNLWTRLLRSQFNDRLNDVLDYDVRHKQTYFRPQFKKTNSTIETLSKNSWVNIHITIIFEFYVCTFRVK